MIQELNHHQNKMESPIGVDLASLGLTFLYVVCGIITDFKDAVTVIVGVTTVVYNVFRIYRDFGPAILKKAALLFARFKKKKKQISK